MNFTINIKPVYYQIEKYIVNSLNKKPPASYSLITENELDQILTKTIRNFPNNIDIINKQLIISIRASWMRNYMMIHHKNIITNLKSIIRDYNLKISIGELVQKYDISPLNILRAIFKDKYNIKLTQLITNNNVLTQFDKEQLDKAIETDAYALINQDNILKESIGFEKQIEKILIKLNIQYKTQEELSEEQIKEHGRPINTPDFLILTDFYICNHKINWIDAKNFYGPDIFFLTSKLKKQTKKYINAYGPGAVIFNLSFNSNLKFNDILLIDYKSFTNIEKSEKV